MFIFLIPNKFYNFVLKCTTSNICNIVTLILLPWIWYWTRKMDFCNAQRLIYEKVRACLKRKTKSGLLSRLCKTAANSIQPSKPSHTPSNFRLCARGNITVECFKICHFSCIGSSRFLHFSFYAMYYTFFTIMSWSMILCVNIDLCIQSEVARNEIGKGKSMTNFVGTFCWTQPL